MYRGDLGRKDYMEQEGWMGGIELENQKGTHRLEPKNHCREKGEDRIHEWGKVGDKMRGMTGRLKFRA